jgi:gluconokinase
VLMGVAGSGKSTIGRLLARDLGWPFHEGDEHHTPANREKMRRGVPLDEDDRKVWLDSIRALIAGVLDAGGDAVVACSALRQAHRRRLAMPGVAFVYLKGDERLIRGRLERRRGHFFDASLLRSQFNDLEEPEDAVTVDIDAPPEAIVRTVRAQVLPGEGPASV